MIYKFSRKKINVFLVLWDLLFVDEDFAGEDFVLLVGLVEIANERRDSMFDLLLNENFFNLFESGSFVCINL